MFPSLDYHIIVMKGRLKMELTNLLVPMEFRKINASPTEQLLLSIIWSFQKNGKPCFASNQTLADLIGVSLRTIKATSKNLKDKGYITIEKKGNKHILAVTEIITPAEEVKEASRQDKQTDNAANAERVQNLHSESAESAPARVQNLPNTYSILLNKDTYSSSSFTSSKVEDKDNKQEEEDFLSKCEEIDDISNTLSHQALLVQAKKRNIPLDEALQALQNAVASQNISKPANFILKCLRNDNCLPDITLVSPVKKADIEAEQAKKALWGGFM